jgi:hypothetical protein
MLDGVDLLPFGVMFFRKTDQAIRPDDLAIVHHVIISQTHWAIGLACQSKYSPLNCLSKGHLLVGCPGRPAMGRSEINSSRDT